ncbi:MAG: Eco57I restriction-modification methylase domain-containing protein [Thermoflexibacter sp.]|nr:Eco57I restriction-modification methylase domain-containing protein [Thermoflexibacter sp.]
MDIKKVKEKQTFFSSFLHSQKQREANINLEIKRQNGVFFTNNIETIDKIISVIDFTIIENKTILEPACGQGILILRILSKVYQQNANKSFIDRFIANNLIFNDIDFEMVEKTKENIQKLYFSWFGEAYKGTFQSFVSDFTIRNNQVKNLFIEAQNTVILERFYDKIDYVIGNPPYISLYGRRDKKQNEQQRINYLQNYNQFPVHVQNGKINLVMLFLEHSLDFLKPNAKLSFIIDLAFFETAYQHTRQFLLENTCIEKLITNITDFEVTSGQLILQLSKSQKNKENQVIIIDEKTKQNYLLNQAIWKNPKDEYKFRLNFCDVSQEIINAIKAKNDKTILEVYPNKNLRTCTMLLDMEDKFTTNKLEDDKKYIDGEIYPYYQGSKSLSEKYGSLKFEKYFHFNKSLQDEINNKLRIKLEKQGIKNKKRIGLGETMIYDNPKVFIRQSAKELIASLDYGKSAANNSLYVFSLRNNLESTIFTLKFLCAWLNSDLMTFFAQQQSIIRFSQGKQPQIKISDLGTIPLPNNNELQTQLVFFATQIIDLQANKKFCQIEINKLVYQYYELNENQISFIQKSIKAF